MFNISSQHSEWKKWIHQFENSLSIIFCVDLSQYDELVLKESNQKGILESLVLFDSVVNSQWFFRASIILLFCNVGRFKEKLCGKPLSNYFPDYNGGNDVSKATRYLLWRFNQLNRTHLNIYPHFFEPSDGSSMRRHVWSAVKETRIHNYYRDSGIL